MKSLRLSIPALLFLIAVAFVVAVQRGSLEARDDRPIASVPMAWDHRVITVTPFDAKPLEVQLNEAGMQRWECVSMTYNSHSGGVYAIMKRRHAQGGSVSEK